jgi:hypothetical protein
MRAKGIPAERAADQLGVPISTFRAWLDGRHLPRVTVLDHWPALARLAGVTEAELLRLAGVLPDAFSSSLLLAQATRELREGLEHSHRLLRQAATLANASAAAQVVNELSNSGIDWEIRLRSAIRGTDVRLVYHHYVGVVPPDQLRDWQADQVRAYIHHEVLGHVWQQFGLYWRVGEVHDWENAPGLLIQVPEQEASRPPTRHSPRPDGPPILVLSPPWGYGELLASLVADGLGYGNIDFRYFGLPDDRPARTERVQAELDDLPAGFAVTVPALMLLDGLHLGADRLRGTIPVLITYGEQVRRRAGQIYDTVLTELAGDADAGIAHIETQYNAALHGLPAGTEYLHVTLADDDVTSAATVNRDRLNDTVARLALAVTSMILEHWQAPPSPVAGPLRDLVLPSGRPRTPPAVASRAEWRTVEPRHSTTT